MGKKGGGSTKTTTQVKLPSWLNTYIQDTLDQSGEVAARPYEPYGGERYAPVGAGLQQTFGNAQDLGGMVSGAGLQAYQGMQAAQAYNPRMVSSLGFGRNVAGYMNPFTQQVVNRSLANLDEARQMANLETGAKARAAGAFGGDRHGLVEAQNNANFLKAAGDMGANLYNQGYTQASDYAFRGNLANQQAGLSGAQLNLAGSQGMQGLATQNLGLSGQIAQAEQEYAQRPYDWALQQWQEEQGWPERQLALRLNAQGTTPYGGTTVQVAPRGGGSPLMGAAGGGLMGLAGASMMGMMPNGLSTMGPAGWAMAGGGALLGALGSR